MRVPQPPRGWGQAQRYREKLHQKLRRGLHRGSSEACSDPTYLTPCGVALPEKASRTSRSWTGGLGAWRTPALFCYTLLKPSLFIRVRGIGSLRRPDAGSWIRPRNIRSAGLGPALSTLEAVVIIWRCTGAMQCYKPGCELRHNGVLRSSIAEVCLATFGQQARSYKSRQGMFSSLTRWVT